ncbi:D-alanyl-D-alanine carboxypeptidase family protein [Paraurantiacibacter namhicola]|uniref:serine-type D-Ala-D-Ala carboxypeptidase n=1 Tax=Paraurantiacibacter namhicola TaxID=645517 RepID=A0A1C7D910_9SPHN|nr:D-alanyl-D-alanine carboxypeptidase family protein [Paraurantiacibacter namhicola]ANU07969.1 D-alanyl-D-alanine carboxypeptidase DacD precursor [Paraurantiacibacter namhicola]
MAAAVAALCLAAPAMTQSAVPAQVNRVASPVPAEVPIALVVDTSTGQTLLSREADRRFVPASVTKVMTAYTAFRLIDEGKLSADSEIEITAELLEGWRREGSTLFLEVGDRVSVEDLLLGITTVSANDASVVLGRHVAGSLDGWTALMNANARKLGLADSHFGTPNGWMDDGNTFTSARDLARLGGALTQQYPNLYGRFFGKTGMRFNGVAQDNHEMLTGQVEGGDGIKTGYTRQAGNTFLGSAKRGDRRIVIVLAGVDEGEVRDSAARAMVRWAYDAFTPTRLVKRDEEIGLAEVQGGSKAQVALVAPKDLVVAVPQGLAASQFLTITYNGPVRAPIAAGDTVATLRFAAPGYPVFEMPLAARDDVPVAGPVRRIGLGLASWFS